MACGMGKDMHGRNRSWVRTFRLRNSCNISIAPARLVPKCELQNPCEAHHLYAGGGHADESTTFQIPVRRTLPLTRLVPVNS